MKTNHALIILLMLFSSACSSQESAVSLSKDAEPNIVQQGVDAVLKTPMKMLNKAKALEGKLEAAEQARLKRMEAFEE